MLSSTNVAGVGRVEVKGDTIIKTITQTTTGSAYMKIPGMVIAIQQAGYTNTILRINKSHPYMTRIETQISLLKQAIPNISIEKY